MTDDGIWSTCAVSSLETPKQGPTGFFQVWIVVEKIRRRCSNLCEPGEGSPRRRRFLSRQSWCGSGRLCDPVGKVERSCECLLHPKRA